MQAYAILTIMLKCFRDLQQNSQIQYNKNGIINAIPIVIYHNIVNLPDVSSSKDAADTTVNLFDQEIKYIHDNGFRVLTLTQLGYDPINNIFYIKNGPASSSTTATTDTGRIETDSSSFTSNTK